MMKVQFIILALTMATVNLFGDLSSPYRGKMSGNELGHISSSLVVERQVAY